MLPTPQCPIPSVWGQARGCGNNELPSSEWIAATLFQQKKKQERKDTRDPSLSSKHSQFKAPHCRSRVPEAAIRASLEPQPLNRKVLQQAFAEDPCGRHNTTPTQPASIQSVSATDSTFIRTQPTPSPGEASHSNIRHPHSDMA